MINRLQRAKPDGASMTRRLRPWTFLLAALCAMPSAHAQWQAFKWGHMDVNDTSSNPHGGIVLPVTLEGHACWMQLDTGSPSSYLYRNAMPAAMPVNAPTAHAHLQVGTLALSRQLNLLYQDDPQARTEECRETNGMRLVGTLGDDVFADSAIELDLNNARFRIFADKAAIPPASVNDRVVPFVMEDVAGGAKAPVVTAHLPDGRPVQLAFDTGSAVADFLVLQQADWLSLVGTEGAKQATKATGASWGRTITCSSAPVQGSIRLQGLDLPAGLEATYCALPDGPAFAGHTQFGTLGMKPFYRQRVVIDFPHLVLRFSGADANVTAR